MLSPANRTISHALSIRFCVPFSSFPRNISQSMIISTIKYFERLALLNDVNYLHSVSGNGYCPLSCEPIHFSRSVYKILKISKLIK